MKNQEDSTVLIYVGLLALVVLIWLAGTWLFQLAWNCLMPAFNGPELTYFQSMSALYLYAVGTCVLGYGLNQGKPKE